MLQGALLLAALLVLPGCGGPAPARAYQPRLLQAVLDGSINPGKVFDLRIDLDHIADGYAAMDEHRAIKALVKVSELKETA